MSAPISGLGSLATMTDGMYLEILDPLEPLASNRNKKILTENARQYFQSKDTIYLFKNGVVNDGDYLGKQNGLSVTSASNTILSPYDCIINSIYIEFNITAFVNPGDLRINITNSTVVGWYGFAVTGTGLHRGAVNFNGPLSEISVSSGEVLSASILKTNGLSATIEDVLCGITLRS